MTRRKEVLRVRSNLIIAKVFGVLADEMDRCGQYYVPHLDLAKFFPDAL